MLVSSMFSWEQNSGQPGVKEVGGVWINKTKRLNASGESSRVLLRAKLLEALKVFGSLSRRRGARRAQAVDQNEM